MGQCNEVRHFFLEADRSTEEHRRLISKFSGYWLHLRVPPALDAGGRRLRVNVLFVTTGETRMSRMIETLRHTPKPPHGGIRGKGLFWFLLRVVLQHQRERIDPGVHLAICREFGTELAAVRAC